MLKPFCRYALGPTHSAEMCLVYQFSLKCKNIYLTDVYFAGKLLPFILIIGFYIESCAPFALNRGLLGFEVNPSIDLLVALLTSVVIGNLINIGDGLQLSTVVRVPVENSNSNFELSFQQKNKLGKLCAWVEKTFCCHDATSTALHSGSKLGGTFAALQETTQGTVLAVDSR